MKHAWRIFAQGWKLAITNLAQFYKIWLFNFLVIALLQAGWWAWLINVIDKYLMEQVPMNTLLLMSFGLAANVLSLLIYAGLAVNSNRLYLDKTYQPRWLPFGFHWKRSFRYFGQMILLLLIYTLIMALPLWIANKWISSEIVTGQIPYTVIMFSVLLLLVFWFISGWVLTRLNNALVATSLGEKLSMREAWHRTRSQSSRYLGILGLCAILMLIFVVLMQAYFGLLTALRFELSLVFYWFGALSFGLAIIFLYAVFFAIFSIFYRELPD